MIGTVLANKYRILSLIGAGGMANVYKAVQTTGTHRTVAIKVLKEEYENDADFLRRFRQEAHAVLNLSHDNIVRSYDVGEQDGHQFIVLEYVGGDTLKDKIRKEGALPPQRAVSIGAQVLDALAHAHERGIIHRDIKPQNVIVTPRNKAKLADFGIARDVSSSTMTFAGTNVLGSVHYIAPEQAKGNPVTVESDLYSMGISLYEMLTGELPFTGDTPVSIALKHLQEDVPPVILTNPAVPKALNDVIMKATRRDPNQRYHSAKAMRQDLLRALREPNGDFVRLREQNGAGKKKKCSRGIWRIGLVTLVALVMLAIMFIMGRMLLQRNKAVSGELVPTLVGKTFEEAQDIARRRTYTLEIIGTQPTDEYEPGVVLSQKPDPSAKLKSGSVISVVVSEGMELPEVPTLMGMTLKEAEMTLKEAGLTMAEPEYRISEYPPGTVYQQDPVAGTQVFEGDIVRVFLSGEPTRHIEMPTVTDLKLSAALKLLQERGYSAFRVRFGAPENDMDEEQVYLQNPAPGESTPASSIVSLSACKVLPAAYGAEVLFHVDITQKETPVLITLPGEIDGVAFERVLYETALDEGTEQMLSFTAMSDYGGDREVILYVDGIEVRRTNVMFSYWG